MELENTLHSAMRNKDDQTRDTIRMVFAAIKMAEIETRKPLDEPGIISILQKEVKIRRETMHELINTDRTELVKKATDEVKILERFLPVQMDDTALVTLVKKVIQEVDAITPADMGKVMKVVLPLIKGQATPDRVSAVVKQLLT